MIISQHVDKTQTTFKNLAVGAAFRICAYSVDEVCIKASNNEYYILSDSVSHPVLFTDQVDPDKDFDVEMITVRLIWAHVPRPGVRDTGGHINLGVSEN